jgi:hypothetical protein
MKRGGQFTTANDPAKRIKGFGRNKFDNLIREGAIQRAKYALITSGMSVVEADRHVRAVLSAMPKGPNPHHEED